MAPIRARNCGVTFGDGASSISFLMPPLHRTVALAEMDGVA